MHTDKYIIWLGTVVSENEMLNCSGVSPAANHWQADFIDSLTERSLRIFIIGHIPEPQWPRGDIYINSQHIGLTDRHEHAEVNYVNLPVIRQHHLNYQYLNTCRRVMARLGTKPMLVISYNATPSNAHAANYMQNALAVPWVCIIADTPSQPKRLLAYNHVIQKAAGRVFLPWKNFEECNSLPKLHLDGGIRKLNFNATDWVSREMPKKVLYAGNLRPQKGVNMLVDAFKLIPNQDVELWICGKGSNSYLASAAEQDNRIKIWGMVNSSELENLLDEADIFVNPRLLSDSDNATNFPSKLLDYLSYGKPIISTWTDGLSPEYHSVLQIVNGDKPECFAKVLKSVLAWDDEKQLILQKKIQDYILTKKTWNIQSQRFLQWLDAEVLPNSDKNRGQMY